VNKKINKAFDLLDNKFISFFILLVSFLPILILCNYNHPSADDFAYGIGQKPESFSELQKNFFYGWSGRYTSTFLISTIMLDTSFNLYRLTPILIIVFTFFTCRYLMILCFTKNVNIITTIFTLIYFYSMPNLNEGIFWLSGSITYSIGNICIIYICGNMSRYLLSNQWDKKRFIQCLIIACIGIGTNETSMVIILVITVFFFIIVTNKIKILRINQMAVLIIAELICVAIVIYCPGNEVRRNAINGIHALGTHDLTFSIKSSFFFTIKKIVEWLRGYSLLLFVSIFMIVKSSNIKISFFGVRSAAPLGFVSFCVIVTIISLGVLPSFWEMGKGPIPRTSNVIYLTFLVLISIWIAVFGASVIEYFKLGYRALLLIFVLHLIIGVKPKNIKLTLSDVVSGRALHYQFQVEQRNAIVNSARSKIEFKPFNRKPLSLFFDDITTDSLDWRNQAFAKFYNKKSVVLVE
jgi:hypothetical protein